MRLDPPHRRQAVYPNNQATPPQPPQQPQYAPPPPQQQYQPVPSAPQYAPAPATWEQSLPPAPPALDQQGWAAGVANGSIPPPPQPPYYQAPTLLPPPPQHQAAEAPSIQVLFEIPNFGKISAYYEQVVVGETCLILIQRQDAKTSRFLPAARSPSDPISVKVEFGNGRVHEADYVSLDLTACDDARDYCTLLRFTPDEMGADVEVSNVVPAPPGGREA
jgi:hypothetical protein